MYDRVKIEDDIEDFDIEHDGVDGWQTKTIQKRPLLEVYKIEDGRLYKEEYHHEKVPKEERPYGDSDKEFLQMCGMLSKVHEGWEDTEYHGIVEIHSIVNEEYISYDLKFTDGKLVNISENDD